MQKNDWPLGDLLKDWVVLQEPHASIAVGGLSIDSRSTNEGDLFFALQGVSQHGLKHSRQALDKGAVAIAWETSDTLRPHDLPHSVLCIEIPELRSKLGFIAQRFYADVSKRMHVAGVTGTDGKTSVSQLIAQALQALNVPCGVIGTLGYGVYPKLSEACHTTPDAIRMHSLLYDCYRSGVRHAVIEASSHGLVQGRLNGVHLNTAVFTNLGRDHMDYHGSVEAYAQAKQLLFKSEGLQNAVINIDDAFGEKLAHEFHDQLNVITCSVQSDADLGTSNIQYQSGKTSFELRSRYGNADVSTTLTGGFNISNLLAVLGVLLANDVDFDAAVNAIGGVQSVVGRLEYVYPLETEKHSLPSVVIDYAHTPQALESVLSVLREQCCGKLYCVFGCGGDRDPGKRALMAQVVERYSDAAVLTDDNPRFEDPAAITNAVEAGFSHTYPYVLIHDRHAAIQHAIAIATTDDVILIAGKGHEKVQIIKDERRPFDDKKIALEILQKAL